MKKLILPLFALLTLAFTVLETSTWNVDKSHSSMDFSVRHLNICDVKGSFDKFDFTVTTPQADFTDATFTLKAETQSINTRLEPRDNHLRSEDFFDTQTFPTIEFVSNSCKQIKGNRYLVKGQFSMHGITKEVSLNVTQIGNSKNRSGADVAGLKITGKINRSDFGVGKDTPKEIVSDEVYLNADFEIIKSKP